jgi:hypothetical protein
MMKPRRTNRMSNTSDDVPGLASEEYARRKLFLDNLKLLSKAENIEIIKILKKNNISLSENQNGILFNVAKLPQSVYDELEKFLNFTQFNRKNLADRDELLSTLKSSTKMNAV